MSDDCTEPNRKACPRMCQDFCNKAETESELALAHGSALRRRLQSHRMAMSPEQKERHAGKLLLDATAEIDRLVGICTHVHDRMLRGDDDMTLMRKLQEGWQGPNVRISNDAP